MESYSSSVDLLGLGGLKKLDVRLVQIPGVSCGTHQDLWEFNLFSVPLIMYLSFESAQLSDALCASLANDGWYQEDFAGVFLKTFKCDAVPQIVYSRQLPVGISRVKGFGQFCLPTLLFKMPGPDRVFTLGVAMKSEDDSMVLPCTTLAGDELEPIAVELDWTIAHIRAILSERLGILSSKVKLIGPLGTLLVDDDALPSPP